MQGSLQLLTQFEKANVKYVLCGGLAVNLYGVPRATADIDILIDLTMENIQKFMEVLVTNNFVSQIPIKLEDLIDENIKRKIIQEKNLIAFSFYSTIKSITTLDVLIDCPLTFNEIWDHKEIRETTLGKIFIISIDHLIQMKQHANRKQDQYDIEKLIKLKNAKSN
ncbi:MAG: hypothetical protein SFY32_15665 [Bacteroidota bacterium]|nr:hypothetical protein [Bacteroidota bacterium]